LNKTSTNVSNSGDFSVQVITESLKVFELEMIYYFKENKDIQEYIIDPTKASAYICNCKSHVKYILKKVDSIKKDWRTLV
jgi:hypothetical protein